ncbi:MAG: pentapeptide repeat-containing protein, partial [Candidatus Acidiferrales bacterium]
IWLDSQGDSGIRADLSCRDLQGAELIDARLRYAILNKSNLARADLMLADLRGASLLQADLRDSNLLGTRFEEASLQAAVLQGATGLANAQFARSNLFGAVLPETISPKDGLKHVSELARRAGWLLASLLCLLALIWLRIFTTHDAQLLKNAPALPFPALRADAPFIPFYLFGPVALLAVYVVFHLFLQRLWDGAAQLPAIFQDGRTLDRCLPWFSRWPAQKQCEWLKKTRSPVAFLEAGIAIVLLYWAAPITILLFWGRYLTLEDLRGSTVHVLLAAGSVLAAVTFPKMAAKAFGADDAPANREAFSIRWVFARPQTAVPSAVGVLLLLLTFGTIGGVPRDHVRADGAGPAGIKSWATKFLWLAGYDPFPQLTEAEVSTKPPAWSGRDEDLAQIQGASLNRASLRYTQGYGAFLVRARLWRADLRYAYLADADLRQANLRQADLQFANLDSARLGEATMQQADLSGANLNRAGLAGADLSSALLPGASMRDAILTGANLYQTDLSGAVLQRASLKQADLREANLENVNLISANLQDAYLTSAKLGRARLNDADLSRAILIGASLRNSDLRGAILQGTILRGADLTGANLQGTDLRGVPGLTWNQVCSAANFAGAQMDESLQIDLQVQCANSH